MSSGVFDLYVSTNDGILRCLPNGKFADAITLFNLGVNYRGMGYDPINRYVYVVGALTIKRVKDRVAVDSFPNPTSGNLYGWHINEVTGDLYVWSNTTLYKAGPHSTAFTVMTVPAPNNGTMCSNSNGDIFIAYSVGKKISKIPVGTETISAELSISSYGNPTSICCDGAGNIVCVSTYYSEETGYVTYTLFINPTITSVTKAQQMYTVWIKMDALGNIYAAQNNASTMYRILKGETSINFTIRGTYIIDLASDPTGGIYICENTINQVKFVSDGGTDGGSIGTFSSGPRAIVYDSLTTTAKYFPQCV